MVEDLTAKLTMDVGEVESELKHLEREIEKLNKKQNENRLASDVIDQKIQELEATRKALEETIERSHSSTATGEDIDRAIEAQAQLPSVNKELDKQYAELDKVISNTEELDSKLIPLEDRYAELQRILAGVRQGQEQSGDAAQKANDELEQTKSTVTEMPSATEAMNKAFERFASRLKTVLMQTFVFGVIMKALQQLKSWLQQVVMQNEEAAQAIATLKGALYTMAAPIVNAVIPALVKLLQVLAKVVTFMAQIVTWLFGTTIAKASESAKALYGMAGGYGAAADAAKEYKRELADFDDLHVLSSDDGSDSSGGGGSGGGVTPNFDLGDSVASGLTDIQKMILSVGALALGVILLFLGQPVIGIALIVAGAAGLGYTLKNGTDGGVAQKIRDNLAEIVMIAGASLLALGLILVLVMPTLGIGLIAAGAAALFGGFAHSEIGTQLIEWVKGVFESIGAFFADWWAGVKESWENIKTNWNLMWTAIGEFFVGVWDKLKQKLVDWWTAIRTQWETIKQSFVTIWTTIKEFFVNTWNNIKTYWQNWKATFMTAWNNIKTSVLTIVSTIKEKFTGAWETIKTGAQNAWQGIKNVFSTVATFFKTIFSNAWTAVKNVFSTGGQIFAGIKEGIASVFKSTVNHIISGINAVVAVPFGAINAALDGLRWIRILKMYPFSWLPSISVPSIPYLAQGAVVPPNREFMAMLGDNKRETEVVSPLSTMEQAMENVLKRMNGKQNIVVNVDGKKLFEVMVDQNNSTVKRTGMSPLKV